MYIERLRLKNVRTFVDETQEFVHPDRTFRPRKKANENGSPLLPEPRRPNVNLLLGDNGSGKSTVLRAIAMAVLGPSFVDSKLPVQGLVRRGSDRKGHVPERVDPSTIEGTLRLHEEEHAPDTEATGKFELKKVGELERVKYSDSGDLSWDPVFESNNDAFFAVGYGATRRVEAPENFDSASRTRYTFLRGQRLQGLFQESFTLIPLETWLPRMRNDNRRRYEEVEKLLNKLLKPSRCEFTGAQERHADYLFKFGGSRIPFRGMSDGYRAFIGWVGDMLFHACVACPRYKRIADLQGVIMVDDIDLQLHPRWQMQVVPTIARTFPRMQFILTSHSPLVAGSLEWMNIITLKLNSRSNSTEVSRFTESIHGLDADQVLISDFFGLKTTRAESKTRQLDELTLQAALGDDRAAERLISKLAEGMEESE
jgi:energy-coupling factor transporter ATP-binding protein EcfA2